MGGTARTRDCRQTDHGPHEPLDEESLAEAPVRLFMEGDRGLARDHRAAGQDEVLLRVAKDPSEHPAVAEGAEIWQGQLRSNGRVVAKGGRPERKGIFRERGKAHPGCAGAESAQRLSES